MENLRHQCVNMFLFTSQVNNEVDSIVSFNTFYIPEVQDHIDIRQDFLQWLHQTVSIMHQTIPRAIIPPSEPRGFVKDLGSAGQDFYQPKLPPRTGIFTKKISRLFMAIFKLNLQQIVDMKCFFGSTPPYCCHAVSICVL